MLIAELQAKQEAERADEVRKREARDALEATRHWQLANALASALWDKGAGTVMEQWTEAQLAGACEALGVQPLDKNEPPAESATQHRPSL